MQGVRVYFYYGPPGCGKTTAVCQRFGGNLAYSYDTTRHSHEQVNYNGQEVVILDNFGGSDAHSTFTPELLLSWCVGDRPCPRRLLVERKGRSPVTAAWNVVVIESNYSFEKLFNRWTLPGWDDTVKAALLSRLEGNMIEM